ncbi:MAG: aminoglycoside phosphotransferase family protein [Actinomycetota bacterium]|nr:aminoglycoside phosphotransferase family protein [Actinomycetota bacterium]
MGLALNPYSPGLHRREIEIAWKLPTRVAAPRLLSCYDDGDWVALVFEDVDGRMPALPWRDDQWRRVHAAMVELAAMLTPSPLPVTAIGTRMGDEFSGWRRLAGAPHLATDLDPWVRANLDRLAEAESHWEAAAAGKALVHGDVRADNIVLTDERVMFVDWPHAAMAQPWVDLLLMLPSVVMRGGPPADEVWRTSPIAIGADSDAVDAVLAAVTGFFVYSALLPAPLNLPRLRGFQRAQGAHALAWLRNRLR